MMSISSFSWNGQLLNEGPRLELTDELVEYNSKKILVPMFNIVGANAVYLFQSGMITSQREIIALQFQQIYNYEEALYSCESEIDILNLVVEEYEKIVDIKDKLFRQEKIKLWAYRILVTALGTYITIYYL